MDNICNNLIISEDKNKYAPIAGIYDLRVKIAEFYNHFYRIHPPSQYTFRNVSVTPGGRAALTRIAASLGDINIGHFIPDYTAYEELLTIFRAFIPIPTPLGPENGYRIETDDLRKEIMSHGLSALLLSNPCNPTGQLIANALLHQWVSIGKELGCTFIFDEFYSHYIYAQTGATPKIVSAAEYIEDVNNDPIIIVDGLTKNWRCPGWRIGWIVGPEDVIETVSSAGSFLDGGANYPLQNQAICLFDRNRVTRQIEILQNHFKQKRDLMIQALQPLKIKIDLIPKGTFYVWINLEDLPHPINSGLAFFEECLKERTIVVPGVFFDVNPGHRRNHSRYDNYVRLSFGPPVEELEQGLAAIERVIQKN